MDLTNLSDDELFGRVEALAETERFSLTDFLVHLGELDNRPACQKRGYASVFAYLTRSLGYSECDAMRRIRAARAARKYPSILRLLAKGDLHLVGLALLQPVLDSENHERLLRKACRRTTREIESMVAALLPVAKEPRDRIRALPPAPQTIPPPDISNPTLQASLPPEPAAGHAPELKSVTESPPALIGRKTMGRVVFTFPADEEVRSWFREAQALLRHKFPEGLMEQIIGEALRRLVENERPGRAHRSRRSKRSANNSRRIPQWIQEKVWRRDGGRCAFVGSQGMRCGETAWLEFDHIKPWCMGGRSNEPANIRLLCRAHNQEEARRLLGLPRPSDLNRLTG